MKERERKSIFYDLFSHHNKILEHGMNRVAKTESGILYKGKSYRSVSMSSR